METVTTSAVILLCCISLVSVNAAQENTAFNLGTINVNSVSSKQKQSAMNVTEIILKAGREQTEKYSFEHYVPESF